MHFIDSSSAVAGGDRVTVCVTALTQTTRFRSVDLTEHVPDLQPPVSKLHRHGFEKVGRLGAMQGLHPLHEVLPPRLCLDCRSLGLLLPFSPPLALEP